MNDSMLPLPGLSPVCGKTVVAKFDGGLQSPDAGILVLHEAEQRLRVADRLAACMVDRRAPDLITHTLAEITRFRLLMIGAGYEDGNDASSLRSDPIFKMALDLLPSDRERCSQSTISHLENLPDARALLRMGRAMVDLYCESFQRIPNRITLDIDDTFDAVHGGQQLRLFNAHYDEYGFQPIVVLDGEGRFVTAVLRPAKRPSGKEVRAFLRRLLRAIRANWPKTEILLRADSHYCSPEVLTWCRTNGIDYILGVAPTTTLRRHIGDFEASTTARFDARRKTARRAASRSSSTGPRAGAASDASSPASKPARTELTHASSSPISTPATPVCSMKMSTAGAAKLKITSSPGRRIWRRTAPHERRLRLSSCGCSCMRAHTGSCGACACRCRSVRCGASHSSTHCVCDSSKSPPASSR